MKSCFTSLLLIIATAISLVGQNQAEWQHWYGFNANFALSNRWSLSLGHLAGMNVSPYEMKYLQQTLSLGWNTRKWELEAGYLSNHSTPLSIDRGKDRVFAGAGIKLRSGSLRINPEVRLEKFLSDNKSFDYRIISTLGIRVKPIKLGKAVRFSPFSSVQLYYNIGGDPITQYNTEGTKSGKYEAYGWHRARVKAGFSVRWRKNLSTWTYVMRQQEFNLPNAVRYYHQINVVNPRTGNITREFNNYWVLGIGLAYEINLKGKADKRDDDNTGASMPKN